MSKLKITTRTQAWVVEGDRVETYDGFIRVYKNKEDIVVLIPAPDLVSIVVVSS